MEEHVEATRGWDWDDDDRCPVCFVPPGAHHTECLYTGAWFGPGADGPPVTAAPPAPAPDGP